MNEQKQFSAFVDEQFCQTGPDEHCATCSDEAQRVRVLSVDQESGIALVEGANTPEEVDISLVDAVAADDLLLIHAGVAIGIVSSQEQMDMRGVRDA